MNFLKDAITKLESRGEFSLANEVKKVIGAKNEKMVGEVSEDEEYEIYELCEELIEKYYDKQCDLSAKKMSAKIKSELDKIQLKYNMTPKEMKGLIRDFLEVESERNQEDAEAILDRRRSNLAKLFKG